MKEQDTLFDQIKSAANSAESPGFDAMEKVWQRVEEKLETKTLKKENNLWKKIAVAASVLLVFTLGYQFFGPNNATIHSKGSITQNDTLQKTLPDITNIAEADTVLPGIKKEANTLLQKQLKPKNQVAYEEGYRKATAGNAIVYTVSTKQLGLTTQSYTTADKVIANWSDDKEEDKAALVKDVEVYINKESHVSSAKKEAPLVVIDDKATNLKSLDHLNAETIDSLEILNEPLYIINGIYYTEKEVFGPNPTSPYTPLDQQDIESISILKDEKAVSVYGEKGKKGVVIIHTKDGKPKVKNAVKPYLDKSKWSH
jgi:TonB-dependent SusC/RagA subfamily outer membrane receptor